MYHCNFSQHFFLYILTSLRLLEFSTKDKEKLQNQKKKKQIGVRRLYIHISKQNIIL